MAGAVSLLDHDGETITVYPAVGHTNAYGQRSNVPAATGVTVEHALIQPVAAQENDAQGQSAPPRYRLMVRGAPLSAWAEVEWNGERYDVVGSPLRHSGSPEVAHITATIQRR